jgi:hypothetical protein
VLELKNGTILDGKFAGGSAGTVRFETSAGVQVIETSQIIALTFTTAAGAATAPVAATLPATPPAAPKTMTLPAGTKLLVRTLDSVSSKNKSGTPFSTTLDTDLILDGKTALKAGTTIYGKVQSSTQAGRVAGQSTLDIRLTHITINGQNVALTTSGYTDAGQRGISKAARGAALGAAAGAIGGDAAKGAAIGGAIGAARKGQTITIPPGTALVFELSATVTVPVP